MENDLTQQDTASQIPGDAQPHDRLESNVAQPGTVDGIAVDGSDSPAAVEKAGGENDAETGHAFAFPVVGIGGSAGSLEPFIEVFQTLPPNTGMAFIVVLHLLPDQESHLPDILGRHTAMPVVRIEEGMLPRADHVYVIPPNVYVYLHPSGFHLEPRIKLQRFLPVNELFQSLASTQKNFSVGVVLSGMDGDGALGLLTIKGEGGFSFVQSPDSARHASMPNSSIEKDHIDMILPPAQLAVQLASLSMRFGSTRWQSIEEDLPVADEAVKFARVLKLLQGVSGIDFRLYKPPTIRRRVARRMMMSKVRHLCRFTA